MWLVVRVYGLMSVIGLVLWIFCIIDAITTPAEQIRNLPKAVWVIIVIVLVDIGSIAWLVAGRDWSGSPNRLGGSGRGPQRPAMPSNPDDDEEFQRFLRQRAEEQRRRAREANPPPDEPPAPAT